MFLSNTSYEYWGRASSLIHIALCKDASATHACPLQESRPAAHQSATVAHVRAANVGKSDLVKLQIQAAQTSTTPAPAITRACSTAGCVADAQISPDVRIYLLAGLQHFSGPFPPEYGKGDLMGQQLMNPNPVRWLWRAMITNMNSWVKDGVEPPPSAYPRVSDGSLVPLERLAFPRIPQPSKCGDGAVPRPASPNTELSHPDTSATTPQSPCSGPPTFVAAPRNLNQAWRLDFGPEWKNGIITNQPPVAGRAFPVLVPQVDSDGNDRAGVRLPEMRVPLATYTGWNLRDPAIGAPDQRVSFIGSYLPFAHTSAERQQSGDQRRSIAERYTTREDYLSQYRNAADELVRERWLLQEDVPAVMERGAKEWDAATSR
jgi:Alpha/beta hydrolase domain